MSILSKRRGHRNLKLLVCSSYTTTTTVSSNIQEKKKKQNISSSPDGLNPQTDVLALEDMCPLQALILFISVHTYLHIPHV